LPPIVNASGISKQFGLTALFHDISFTVSEGDRIGLIGPNGSGKSTLLGILSGRMESDSGDVAIRKRTRMSFVAQISEFAPGETVGTIIGKAIGDVEQNQSEIPGRAGFMDFSVKADSLSGGWKKRLAIVEALVQKPDILMLDEPTNHLDLAGIQWLESVLKNASFACVIVSHDRYLLENVALEVVELNRIYSDGLLRVKGNYSTFLEAKDAYLHAQGKYQEALANRVHSEIEWLRRGAKARTRKSKARIGKAGELIGELAELKGRTRTANVDIDFTATDRKTKVLVELDQVSVVMGNRALFENLSFAVKSRMRVGLVGPNGSGKTTFLRLLRGELEPARGTIRKADQLRIVYFDQNRELDPGITLRRALAPDSDAVVYQDRVIHVAAWAERFLFASEALNQPVGRLSGGERARVLIAQLMLQPSDLLLLDEPTNDLDIPTLEILEESLMEYTGALALVTHDRYLLDRVSTTVLGLDGLSGMEVFADYSQWETWQRKQSALEKSSSAQAAPLQKSTSSKTAQKKKLSYAEARELESMEQRLIEAENQLQLQREMAEDPAIASNGPKLLEAHSKLLEVQEVVDRLYARWHELELKQQS
jgi:ATP-binding cassette subfamily F protein uup